MADVAATPAAVTPAIGRGSELGLAGTLLLGAGAAAAIYFIAVPLGMLFITAFSGPADLLPFEPGARASFEHVVGVYTDPVIYGSLIPDTLTFAAGAVSVCFVTAFLLAWLVERTDLPGRELVFTLVVFPLLVPSVVLAMAWILMFGPNSGFVNLALRALFGGAEGPLNIFSMPGLILAQAMASTPYVFLLLSAVLRSMNPSLEEASAASGASLWRTFFRITLPVLRPGILAPLILISLITLEQFDLPLIIGLPAKINVFSARIWWELNPTNGLPNYGRAAAVGLPFLALGILLLVVYNRLIRQSGAFVTVTGKGYRPARFALGQWRAPALVFAWGYIAAAALLPALVLVWTSVFGYSVPSVEQLARGSIAAYAKLFKDSDFWNAVGNTLIVAASSAAIIVVIGALLAWIVVRTRMPGRKILDFVSFMSIGIPSVIAGLAAMLFYLTLKIGVYGTVWVLALAYSYRIATATRLNRAGLMQIHAELEEASYASGGHWFTTLRRVVMPLLAPSLVAAYVLLFIVGVREFTIPLVLFSPENEVLSVMFWRLFSNGLLRESSALGFVIIALVLPVIFLARRVLYSRGP